MKFIYQARTKEGEVKSGIIEASSKEAALSLLQKLDFFVTYLEEEKKAVYFREIKLFKKIPIKDIILFFRQFSIMMNSKIPLVDALSTIGAQTKKKELKEIILDISQEVEAGISLSKAFLKHKKIFSTFQIAMIKAGEVSGKLSECLNYLADHMEREYLLKSKIGGALIYPAIVFTLFLGIGTVMIFSVVPSFEKIFAETKIEIPFFTKIVFLITTFLRKYIFLLIILIIFAVFLILYYSKTAEGKKFFDRFFLKIPYLGQILKQSIIARFASNLSTLSSAGLMVVESLEIIQEIIENTVYKEIISELKEEVKKGFLISSVLALHEEEFPSVFTQMIAVGERTGNLTDCLRKMADFYQKETERATENFLGLLEPLLIVFLAVLVGSLMASILIPLYRVVGSY